MRPLQDDGVESQRVHRGELALPLRHADVAHTRPKLDESPVNSLHCIYLVVG
jgi:hypothetical protein